MDLLFLEELRFKLSALDWAQAKACSSMGEALERALAYIGIELIDYGSFTAQPQPNDVVCISAYSKAYRERVERQAAWR